MAGKGDDLGKHPERKMVLADAYWEWEGLYHLPVHKENLYVDIPLLKICSWYVAKHKIIFIS